MQNENEEQFDFFLKKVGNTDFNEGAEIWPYSGVLLSPTKYSEETSPVGLEISFF